METIMKLTKKQQIALLKIWQHHKIRYARIPNSPYRTFLQFRRDVQPYPDRSGCVGIMVGLIYIGIETDGYAHT
jgi:hypothetical protein